MMDVSTDSASKVRNQSKTRQTTGPGPRASQATKRVSKTDMKLHVGPDQLNGSLQAKGTDIKLVSMLSAACSCSTAVLALDIHPIVSLPSVSTTCDCTCVQLHMQRNLQGRYMLKSLSHVSCDGRSSSCQTAPQCGAIPTVMTTSSNINLWI